MSDRLAVALSSILRALQPKLAYYATYEYQTISATPIVIPPAPLPAGTTVMISCQAIDPPVLVTFPSVLTLPLWPGPSGLVAIPSPGTLVRVQFINGDPARAVIVGLDPAGIYTMSALASFATALSLAGTIPQIVAAGTLLRTELTGV